MRAVLVFDNTPLSHFSRAGRLDVLQKLVAPYRCVTPAEVASEITAGVTDHPSLAFVLSALWLEIVELTEVEELVAFARYKAELGGGQNKNSGEAAVLAWTYVHGGIAVIDERAGVRIAQREGIAVHGTLWLVANAVLAERLSRRDAEAIVDELVATDMALPVDGAALFAGAYQEGLLDAQRSCRAVRPRTTLGWRGELRPTTCRIAWLDKCSAPAPPSRRGSADTTTTASPYLDGLGHTARGRHRGRERLNRPG